VPEDARSRLVELAGLDGLAGFIETLENRAHPPDR
jgi:hypothetical protein